VKPHLDSILYLTTHGGAAEVDIVPCFKSLLCHSRLLWLAQAYISRVKPFVYFGSWICCKVPINRIGLSCLLVKEGYHPRNFNEHGGFNLLVLVPGDKHDQAIQKYSNWETKPSQANS
jgi:hypothetical protein